LKKNEDGKEDEFVKLRSRRMKKKEEDHTSAYLCDLNNYKKENN
jgi:hypothetical protein